MSSQLNLQSRRPFRRPQTRRRRFRWRWVWQGLAILLGAYILWSFSTIVSYIVLAAVLSLLGRPLSDWLRYRKLYRWRIGDSLAALLTLFAIWLFFVAVTAIFVPLVVHQVQNMRGLDASEIVQALEQPLANFEQLLARLGVSANLKASLRDLLDTHVFQFQYITNALKSVAGFTGAFVIGFFSVSFITFYLLRDRGLLRQVVVVLTPDSQRNKVSRVLQKSKRMLSNYLLGLLGQLTVFVVVTAGLLTLFGVPDSLLIGLAGGLLNIVPYVGPILGFALGLIITLTSNLQLPEAMPLWELVLKVGGAFAIAQMIDNYIAAPRIFSSSVSAHPLEIFLVILVGGKLGGIGGMVLAIPSYTIIRVVLQEYLSENRVVKALTRDL